MKGLFHKFPSFCIFHIGLFCFFCVGGGGGHKIEVLASGIIKPLHATGLGRLVRLGYFRKVILEKRPHLKGGPGGQSPTPTV